MKSLSVIFALLAALSASAAVFNVGSKLNPATVEVTKKQDRLFITCEFKAQTKFSADRNAFFNSRKAQNLCQQGILLYYKAKNGQQIDMSGIIVEKNPVISGKMIKYFYSKIVDNSKPTVTNIPQPPPVTPIVQTSQAPAVQVPAVSNIETAAHRKDSVMFVYRYETENGNVKVVETKTYSRRTFKNQQEFDDFCEKQFQSIDDLAEKNRQEVLDNFEKNRQMILNK